MPPIFVLSARGGYDGFTILAMRGGESASSSAMSVPSCRVGRVGAGAGVGATASAARMGAAVGRIVGSGGGEGVAGEAAGAAIGALARGKGAGLELRLELLNFLRQTARDLFLKLGIRHSVGGGGRRLQKLRQKRGRRRRRRAFARRGAENGLAARPA